MLSYLEEILVLTEIGRIRWVNGTKFHFVEVSIGIGCSDLALLAQRY